jgi:iron(III) transport system permease protein
MKKAMATLVTIGGGIIASAVVVAVLLPLFVLVGAVLGLPSSPSLAALRGIVSPANLIALRETLVVAGGGAFVAALLGLPLAVLLERTRLIGAGALGALCALPLAIPPYLLAFAFRAAFDDRIGLIPWPARVLVDIDSATGIAVVLGVSLLPVVVLRVRATLRAIDGALEEAARTAGASAVRALLDVTVPLALPSAAAAVALVFVAGAAAYGVPVLLGLAADPPIVVVTARIAVALQGGAALQDALGLSVALAGLAGVAFTLPLLLGRGAAVVTGKAQRPTRLDLGAARWPLSLLCWAVAAVLIVCPITALLLQGLTLRAGDGLHPGNFGLHHVLDVLGRSEVRDAVATSAALAAAAAAIIVSLAVVVVVTRRRSSGRSARALRLITGLMELAYALPGTVVAVAMVLTFSLQLRLIVLERVSLTLALGGTTALLLLAYVVKEAAIGFRAVDEALDQLHPSLEEAARIAGAGPLRAFVDVTLPLLRAHLVAAAVAVALPCFTELTMSVLLQAPGRSTLGVVLFSLYEYGDPQEAMALAATLVVIALLGQGAIHALRRRQPG